MHWNSGSAAGERTMSSVLNSRERNLVNPGNFRTASSTVLCRKKATVSQRIALNSSNRSSACTEFSISHDSIADIFLLRLEALDIFGTGPRAPARSAIAQVLGHTPDRTHVTIDEGYRVDG